MYGLVNKAIQQLICQEHGEETWDRVLDRAGCDLIGFIGHEPYPDQMTYDLAAAAAEELGASQEALLEAFGEYWMLYTANEGYGELLSMAGASLLDFLSNLDQMHARVGLSMPELRPPSFRLERAGEDALVLHYHSERAGLAPMVIGLLRGLSKRFETPVSVTRLADGEECHARFQIELGARRAA